MSDSDDKRQAAGMAIGVSNQVMAAALAMLAILGAVFVFILDKRTLTPWKLIVLCLPFISFATSVFAGAKGIATVYKKGHEGEWNYSNGNPEFQIQALTVILGVILFPVGIVLIGKPPDTPSSSNAAPRLQHSIDSLMSVNSQKSLQLQELTRLVDSLKKSSSDSIPEL